VTEFIERNSPSLVERAIEHSLRAELHADEAIKEVGSIKEAVDKLPTVWQLRAYLLAAIVASRFVPVEDVASAAVTSLF
jgi:hypothetical protein